MIKSTMRLWILSTLLVGLAVVPVQAQDSYLGVYALPLRTLSVEGDLVGYTTEKTLEFEINVSNEEGHEELFFSDGLAGGHGVSLRHDGQLITVADLVIEWGTETTRYSFSDPLPQAPSRSGVLEPGVGMRTELRISQADGSPFAPGAYELRLKTIPQGVTRADGSAWSGRGGLGGAYFRLEEVRSQKDRKRMLLIRAMRDMTREHYEAAREKFAEVVALDPADVDAWTGWGLASFHLDEHAKAAEAMEKAMPRIVSLGLHSTLPNLLAESYVFLGEFDKARATLATFELEQDIEPALDLLKAKVERKRASQ